MDWATKRMPQPHRRDGTRNAQFRRRIPADVRTKAVGLPVVLTFDATASAPARVVHATHGKEFIRFSLGTADAVTVAMREALASAHMEQVWNALRSGPISLTHRQVVALSKQVYDTFIDAHSEEPATPAVWAAVKGYNRAVSEGRITGDAVTRLTVADPAKHVALAEHVFNVSDADTPAWSAAIDALPRSPMPDLEARYGELADYVLATKALTVDDQTRARLLVEIDRASTDAAATLKANARGDYTPDPAAQRFPEFVVAQTPTPPPAETSAGPSWDALISAWEKRHEAADKQPTSRPQFRSAIERFAAWSKQKAPLDVVRADVKAYVAHRLASVSAATVRRSDITNLRRLYAVAVQEELLPAGFTDPTHGVEVIAPSGTSLAAVAARRRGYTDAEANVILNAAATEHGDPLFRYVPLILAYSGARVAEIVGLRACDVVNRDGIACLNITPEAGRHVKTQHSIRHIPLHKAVIDAGFLEYAATKTGTDRLFPVASPRSERTKARRGRTRRRGVVSDTSIAVLKPGKTSVERLRRWLRSLPGIAIGKEHGVDPNHAWRHRLKTKARDAGIDGAIIDAICGHAPASVGAGYGEYSVKAKAAALAKIG